MKIETSATSNTSQPYHPFSGFRTDREFEEDFADRIHERMSAGSSLLFVGSESSLASLLRERGLINDQTNPFDFPANGAKSCHLHLPDQPYDTETVEGNNALNMKKTIFAMILKENHDRDCNTEPLIVCLGRNSTHIIDDKSLVHLLEVQRDYRMEILIADYAVFMGLPDDVKSIYLGNKIFDQYWKQDRQ